MKKIVNKETIIILSKDEIFDLIEEFLEKKGYEHVDCFEFKINIKETPDSHFDRIPTIEFDSLECRLVEKNNGIEEL